MLRGAVLAASKGAGMRQSASGLLANRFSRSKTPFVAVSYLSLQPYQHNVFLTLRKNQQKIPANVLALNLRVLLETDGQLSAEEMKLAVRALGKVGDAELTKQLLDKFLRVEEMDPSELGALHGAVLKTLCATGLHEDALGYFRKYQEHLNEMHATILFRGLKGPQSNDECIHRALDLVLATPPDARQLDVISYASLFSLCGMASVDAAPGVLRKALNIFEDPTVSGAVATERVVYNALLLLAAKARDTQTVQMLLEKMKQHQLDPSPATFSALLLGAAHGGNYADAIQIGRQLLAAEGYVMDHAVMHAFLQSCKHVGEHQLAIDAFEKWQADAVNVPSPKLLLVVNHHASKTGNIGLIKRNWQNVYPAVNARETETGREIFAANTVLSLLRAGAYVDAVRIAESLELSPATLQTWNNVVRAMQERQDWHNLLALSGRFELRTHVPKSKFLVQRTKAAALAAMLGAGQVAQAEAFYKTTTARLEGTKQLLYSHQDIASSLLQARASQAAPHVLSWHAALLQKLQQPVDEDELTLERLAECLVHAAESDDSSSEWVQHMQQIYELKPTDSIRTFMAYVCRSKADFDRYLSTFEQLERSDVTAIARALSFSSPDVVEFVVDKLQRHGVDVDANLTLRSVLSFQTAKSGALEESRRHLSAALEQLQVTSPGPMGLFVLSQLAQSLCLHQEYETAVQLVRQHLESSAADVHMHIPDRAGERRLVSDLVDALLSARQGHYLETILPTFDTNAITPFVLRGDTIVSQLPSLEANLVFIFNHLMTHSHDYAATEKGVRVMFPCHIGIPNLSPDAARAALVDVLRTFPYHNAAFRVLSKHPDRVAVSTTKTPLGGVDLAVRLNIPPTVVSGLLEKRKVRDKSHRKQQ